MQGDVVAKEHVNVNCYEVIFRFILDKIEHIVPLKHAYEEGQVVEKPVEIKHEASYVESMHENGKFKGFHQAYGVNYNEVCCVGHQPPVTFSPKSIPIDVEI